MARAKPIRELRSERLHSSVGFTHPIEAWAFVLLLVLLVLPVYALSRLYGSVDWRILTVWPAIASFVAYMANRSDKRRAERGAWRISESTLHLFELAGGWPGAYLSQRRFRHKTSKISYQAMFWSIVLLHEFIALDSLTSWQYSKLMIHLASRA